MRIMWDHLPRRSYAVSTLKCCQLVLLTAGVSISTTLALFLITLNWFDRSPPTYDINSIFEHKTHIHAYDKTSVSKIVIYYYYLHSAFELDMSKRCATPPQTVW